MNTMIAALLAFAAVAAHAAPVDEKTPIPILAYNFDGPNPDGSYAYNFETANGINAEEQGALKQINEKEVAMNVNGAYSYVDENGTPISVTYVADENGFQPKGAHLPTPPPIPAAILRALEYIAAHPEEDNQQ